MTKPAVKDPTAPASPDASRLPKAPYHEVITGQPALVTGANSGIGKAVALGLARAGADVAVNYVSNPEAADDVAHEIDRRRIVMAQKIEQPVGLGAPRAEMDIRDEERAEAPLGRIVCVGRRQIVHRHRAPASILRRKMPAHAAA